NNTFNKSRRRKLNSGIRSTTTVLTSIATSASTSTDNTTTTTTTTQRRQQQLQSQLHASQQHQQRQRRTAATTTRGKSSSSSSSSASGGGGEKAATGAISSSSSSIISSSYSPSLMVAFYHQGRRVSLDRIWDWINGSSTSSSSGTTASPYSSSSSMTTDTDSADTSNRPQFPLYLTLSTTVRLLGGIDRQNRVGSKFGGGGVSSSQNSERERKERLKQLALESIDLAKDPYLMRNHLGTYECKLCLTLHTNEANYLAHTQGKKHQQGLAKRAYMEKIRAEREEQQQQNLKRPPSQYGPLGSSAEQQQSKKSIIKIGRPAYQVFKSRDVDTDQRCLTFELTYKDINDDLRPRHRFMSAYEQKVDVPPDRRYQYVLFAAEPYETIAFKIPNEPLDRNHGRLITHWDDDDKKFTLTLYFADNAKTKTTDDNDDEVAEMETDDMPTSSTKTTTTTASSPFAPALGTS
ncbi:MAG: splicing factor 3A subunit 2, partial [Bacillariaceae sp.]